LAENPPTAAGNGEQGEKTGPMVQDNDDQRGETALPQN
jgi:hypothetical protein